MHKCLISGASPALKGTIQRKKKRLDMLTESRPVFQTSSGGICNGPEGPTSVVSYVANFPTLREGSRNFLKTPGGSVFPTAIRNILLYM